MNKNTVYSLLLITAYVCIHYSAWLFISDVDECKTPEICDVSICPAMTCVNTPGSYKCQCGAGFKQSTVTEEEITTNLQFLGILYPASV